MSTKVKLVASIAPNDRDSKDKRHVKIHFFIETGDFRTYANGGNVPLELASKGCDIFLELDFSTSGYNTTFVESKNKPEPMHKEIVIEGIPTEGRDFDYTLKAGYSSLKDRKIEEGLISSVEFLVRADNTWADVKHGTLAMPAYMIMLRLRDLRVNGRSYFGNCETQIIIRYVGSNFQIEWIDSTNLSNIKTWSSRYALVEDTGLLDIYCQLSPAYRVDNIIAIIFELVAGGIFGILLALISAAPNLLVLRIPFIIGLSIVMIIVALYIWISLCRYRLGPRILNIEAI